MDNLKTNIREERIELAVACLYNDESKQLFRKLANEMTDYSIFWDDEGIAELENDSVNITVTSIR
jgi:hypothetical protein